MKFIEDKTLKNSAADGIFIFPKESRDIRRLLFSLWKIKSGMTQNGHYIYSSYISRIKEYTL